MLTNNLGEGKHGSNPENVDCKTGVQAGIYFIEEIIFFRSNFLQVFMFSSAKLL